jgi:hypothetical protein
MFPNWDEDFRDVIALAERTLSHIQSCAFLLPARELLQLPGSH